MNARVGLVWLAITAALGCAGAAPASSRLEYTASAPLLHDDLVWYSVVRHRPGHDDQAFVVTCGTDAFADGPLLAGIDTGDCQWQDIGGPRAGIATEPERGGRARRQSLAERATTVGEIDRTTAGELTDDDPSESRWGSPYDDYPVRLREGWTIEIDHMSSDFDCYLFLLGPNGEELDSNDDGGRGLNSRIVYRATSEGTYVVRAAALGSSGRGSYTVRIQTRAP